MLPEPDWAKARETINWKLLDLCIEHAILHPEQFDMMEWMSTRYDDDIVPDTHVNGPVGDDEDMRIVRPSCGTSACLAGTAVLLTGHHPVVYNDGGVWVLDENNVATTDGETIIPVEDAARDLLGVRHLDLSVVREMDHYYPGLFYGPDVESVIEWRNTAARLCGVKERGFTTARKARKLLDKLDTAWVEANRLRASVIAGKAAKQNTAPTAGGGHRAVTAQTENAPRDKLAGGRFRILHHRERRPDRPRRGSPTLPGHKRNAHTPTTPLASSQLHRKCLTSSLCTILDCCLHGCKIGSL